MASELETDCKIISLSVEKNSYPAKSWIKEKISR